MPDRGENGDVDNAAQGALPRGALGAWWWQGTRSAFLLRPDWSRLSATPAITACLFLVPSLAGVLIERLYIAGPARFYWPGLASGWMGSLLVLWCCWLLLRDRSAGAATGPRDAASLFAMLSAQSLPLMIAASIVVVPLARNGSFATADGPLLWLVRAVWLAIIGWFPVAAGVLVWRSTPPALARRLASLAILAAVAVLDHWLMPSQRWYAAPADDTSEAAAPERWRLTQEVMEGQVQVLHRSLQALAPQRPHAVDVYVLTFAPYAEADVFRRESEMVAEVMKTRFGAEGRTVQLINHRETAASHPWATRLNLRRAIARVAETMDRDEDILFIHFASHGARDGKLSAALWPMDVDPVTPQLLRQWLDEAGIAYRIVSVSACYSGTWIAPLSDPGTLVMTAADAEHTSYGCGRRSELTYFGRAMYDENMRSTWSFERAHALARTVIQQRETEAGKQDGFSNPQILVGGRIRGVLGVLEAQQEASAAH